MQVDPATTAHHVEHGGEIWHFCSARCADKFRADPAAYPTSKPVPDAVAAQSAPGVIWTCPMHPEVRRNAPGSCPICGMALEP
jgi:Cu+-exporting ATPase